ncbi:LysR substrate-binding domain-containing protein [Aestuariispira insulae]|uniref:LysR family transcriptional regulator n=1 Tax=Aestuariispira insulae TaxID=1461337 RepID=A0A3D9H5Q1_9PROT|nr:LysR substrate-binding domain-containing protein [Aestuariispira insulae]RED44840.1 LysR family transcriptional regulator [Aestuariispira insulae]
MAKFNYSQIRAFNAVARLSNISAAANRLGVTQPAITAQIRTLEKSYGVMLFERSNTGVRLTKLGRQLYRETASLDEQEEVIDHILGESAELKTGELRIVSGAPSLCVELLSEFNRLYPQVRLDVRFGNWGRVTSAIFERQADLAILTNPPEDEKLHMVHLIDQRLDCLVPEHHPLAQQASVSFRELADYPVIFRNGASITQRTVDDCLARAGLRLEPMVSLETREAVYEAVAEGMGVGFMLSAASKRQEKVRRVPILEAPENHPEKLFCLRPNLRRRVVQAFFDVAEEWAHGQRPV